MERVKREDTVQVVAGKDASGGPGGKGKRGRVVRVYPQREMALVEGANLAIRHEPVQRTRRGDKSGGIQHVEMPIRLSNVMPVCPSCDVPTRVGFRADDGEKKRVCKKCGDDF
jgi:large subunit ribosomal protein L24